MSSESSETETHSGNVTVARNRVPSAVRDALLTGGFVPGNAVTLRGLASRLGVSPMPVREAIRALAAANALDILPNGHIRVPAMTRRRFNELLHTRVLLEPHLATLAIHDLSRAVPDLVRVDDAIDENLVNGDVTAYMRHNHEFHFRIYRAAGSEIILPLVEHVWLQFAPFMRTVYARIGTSALEDRHKEAIAAIKQGDREALRLVIERDILDGMGLIGRSVPEAPETEDVPRTLRNGSVAGAASGIRPD
ncbi:GntR family transcriptional regulator [Breoghania sp.]|uniref:GntR family transcriptional regulator n=1 Tax=Breoghania sp. TaxID=2065378 RepID=UPI0026048109|nr:GntR family transcriptional regulator [Breoghania sp.]MDJ0930088.1 GntR family transcriptional regulator [Breoghania sp.]